MVFDPVYILLFIFVLGLNIIPGFMPPTWVVLAFFFVNFNLELIPTVILGATAATLGRIVLFVLAKSFLRRFFSKGTLENYDYLGKFLKTRETLTIPIVLTYAFLPVPSNQVFILAGLADLNIKLFAASFFAGRLISYAFWVHLSSIAYDRLESIFTRHFASYGTVIGEIIGFGLVYLIGRINWKKILFDRLRH